MRIEIVSPQEHVLHISPTFTVSIADEGGFWGVKVRKWDTPVRVSSAVFSKKSRPTRADATFEALRQISDWLYPELQKQQPAKPDYNGWHNYETWVVYTWTANNEGTDRDAYDIVKAADERKSDAAADLHDWFETRYSRYAPQRASVWNDLMGHALASVDWEEIANHYREAKA